jgi:3'-phosphoadenosine 5'-phosphosulfate (PAPS) 3'-phosphatase
MSAHGVLKTSTRAFSRLGRINSPHRVRFHRRNAMPTVGAIVAGTGETVRLLDILSTCVDAAQKGCEEIRAVQARRASSGQLASTMKDIDDPRSALTEADLNAQKAVVDRIRATWPNLRIVGEEDEDETNEVDVSDPELQLRRDLCDVSSSPSLAGWSEPVEVLTVFVDPVDGTREFVEERLDAVQCLVGVACRGRAVAGAIGLPFPGGTLSEPTSVVWGIAAPGATSGVTGIVGEAPKRPRLSPETKGGVVCITGDSKNASLTAAKRAVDAAGNAMIGGAGNKILAVAEGRAEVALMHFGTSLWDTCAPEAVLRAAGGKVTDLFGAPLVHDPSRPGGLINDLGVLATGHDIASIDAKGRDHAAMAAAMRSDEGLREALLKRFTGEASNTPGANEAQATDIARSLEGAPLEASWVGERIAETLCGGQNDFTLKGYAAPETSAIRGLMSDACRLELVWDGEGSASGMPSTVFYKKVNLGDLEYARTKSVTQPMKIARDVKSAGVEAAFLACEPVASALAAAGVKVPRCFNADLRPREDDPIESSFALLLEDFAPHQGWRSERLLSRSQARAALTALARLHATFMPAAAAARTDGKPNEDVLLAGATAAIWPSGAYWQPDMQPASQMTELAQIWRDIHLPNFEKAFAAELPKDVEYASLGDRLQEVAVSVGGESHPFGLDAPSGGESEGWAARWRTVIHGDAKSANIFLRENPDEKDGWEVGLIDFQWMGFGLGAVDAAHVLCASCDPEALGYDETGKIVDERAGSALLDHYYSELITALTTNGAAASVEEAAATWTREEVQNQYEAAVLDMCRVVFGYQWVRVKASPETLAANFDSMNRNSYNKSLPNAMWLVRECDALLKKRAGAQTSRSHRSSTH